jgi:hypothetical protein
MATTCKLIAKSVLGADAASVTLGSGGTIPQTYTDLVLLCSWRNVSSGAGGYLRINGDTGSNYSYRGLRGVGSTPGSFNSATWVTSFGTQYDEGIFFNTADSTLTADTFASVSIYIPNYAGSTNKSVSVDFAAENNGTTAYVGGIAGLWSSTAAITSVTLISDGAGDLKSGSSFFLYGITKA